jgi:flavin reductase (DIM6/NTAB) family NADH-FMN oxidoreductase RutF
MELKEANQVFDLFPRGVFIVTASHGKREGGLTAACVAHISWDPHLIMVGVSPKRFTHKLIDKSNAFAVNVVSEKQLDVARYFGSVSSKNEDKFAKVAFEIKQTGSPILEESPAWLDCKLVKKVTTGDHTLFIGEVVDFGLRKHKGKALKYKKTDFY